MKKIGYFLLFTVLLSGCVLKKKDPTVTKESSTTTIKEPVATTTETSSKVSQGSSTELTTTSTTIESTTISATEKLPGNQSVTTLNPNQQQALTQLEENAAKVGYGLYDFKTGSTVTGGNFNKMISASVIKLFVLTYCYDKGVSLNQIVDGERLFDIGQRMIQVSDNQAANKMISFLGMANLNAYFKASGYYQTEVQRLMLDDEARNKGLDNYTSVKDALNLLKKIYQGHNDKYQGLFQIMLGQQVATKIRQKIPGEIPVANKTGELADVENDIGIVLDPKNPFAIVVLTNGVYNGFVVREAIADLSYASLKSMN